ncbi:hypothetical protein CLV51_102862 [Chitinophaga niastensis]|uniref:DUF4919 domain-containing protein n=1 Tax=Chitinophaga niastensis TaxID=536980 RepID=A0A2P8HP55_CHINA|nr:hypothetical protein [Chitinophaga niastensis]PSL48002.1 hypothetical protein CLV51_102862 [Chitinophaga niastensis]
MKKTVVFLALLATYCTCSAQESDEWKEPGKESQAYHTYREKITRPPYNLQKINTLIEQIKSDDNENAVLNQKIYLSLSLREKFTYHVIHPESYSQNCDAMPPIPDEDKKIFAQLPDAFGEYSWSERQVKFFSANHDSVVAYISASIGRTNRIGVNFKKVITDINATEMIPLLISTYNTDHKDHDILTVLMLLMKNNEYAPFLVSPSYKKLFANQETSYQAFLNFNTPNEELIINRATSFYNGLPKKN